MTGAAKLVFAEMKGEGWVPAVPVVAIVPEKSGEFPV